jgi:hypothetical protein
MPDYTTLQAQIELFKDKVDELTATTLDANELVLLASALNAIGASLGVNDILNATLDRIAAIETAKNGAITEINSSVNGARLTSAEGTITDHESRIDNVENFISTVNADFSSINSSISQLNSIVTTNTPNTWKVITDNTYNIANKDRLLVIPNAGQTLTLPVTPAVGSFVAGTAGTTNFTVARNGSLIQGQAINLTFNVNGGSIGLVFAGSAYGWRII